MRFSATLLRALSVLPLVLVAAGCGSKGDDSAAAPGKGTAALPASNAPRPSGSGAAFAGGFSAGRPTAAGTGAAPAGDTSPTLTAIAAGTWKDPGGGPDVKLVMTKLDKCFGFKPYSMKLPEGTTFEALLGARSCEAKFPGAKKGLYNLVVISDELKIPLTKKEELKNILEKTYDTPDAFLFKYDAKGKTDYVGWWEKKVGKYTLRCNPIQTQDAEPYTYDFQRAVIELCRTLESTAL